jgi:hypothetical protein
MTIKPIRNDDDLRRVFARLEQIFQAFANQKIDDDNARKLTFKKTIGNPRAELYTERASQKFKSYSQKQQEP